jgi:hypothetical protein
VTDLRKSANGKNDRRRHALASRFAFFSRDYKREKNMKRTLLTLLAGLGIIAAGAVQTSVRHHAQAVQVKTLMLR